MNRFDLVIFDCDGTLVDSEALNNLALVQVLDEAGIPGYTLDYAYAHFIGKSLDEIRDIVEKQVGRALPPTFADAYIRKVNILALQELRPVEGAAALVEFLQNHRPVCVASNGERDNVLFSLEQAGLSGFFPERNVFTKCQVSRPKPAPDLFLYAANAMGAVPSRCLVLEDSVVGTTAAAAAGMSVIGFTGAHAQTAATASQLRDAGAFGVVNRLDQVGSLLHSER